MGELTVILITFRTVYKLFENLPFDYKKISKFICYNLKPLFYDAAVFHAHFRVFFRSVICINPLVFLVKENKVYQ